MSNNGEGDTSNVVQMPARATWAVPEGANGDAVLLLNFRAVMRNALASQHGVKVTDSGFGMGEADLGFDFQGRHFNATIKVRT